MPLFKKVNGVRVQLTEAEEQETYARYERKRIKKEKEDLIKEQERTQKKEKEDSLMTRLGLTQEEFDMIKNG